MPEVPYSKREIDNLHKGIGDKLDDILKKVTFTNGKVRKIIIFIVLLTGVVIGQTFKGDEIIKIVLGIAT